MRLTSSELAFVHGECALSVLMVSISQSCLSVRMSGACIKGGRGALKGVIARSDISSGGGKSVLQTRSNELYVRSPHGFAQKISGQREKEVFRGRKGFAGRTKQTSLDLW